MSDKIESTSGTDGVPPDPYKPAKSRHFAVGVPLWEPARTDRPSGDDTGGNGSVTESAAEPTGDSGPTVNTGPRAVPDREPGAVPIDRIVTDLGNSGHNFRARRRGRPVGSTNTAKPADNPGIPAAEIEVSRTVIEGVVSIHKMLAMIIQAPEFEVTEAQAKAVLEVNQKLAAEYDYRVTSKTVAWSNFWITMFGVYGTKCIQYGRRKNAEPKKPEGIRLVPPNTPKAQPNPPSQQAPAQPQPIHTNGAASRASQGPKQATNPSDFYGPGESGVSDLITQ